jgi:hypothetical protein
MAILFMPETLFELACTLANCGNRLPHSLPSLPAPLRRLRRVTVKCTIVNGKSYEVPQNVNKTIGNLGLSQEEENQLVTFLKALTDGYMPPAAKNLR